MAGDRMSNALFIGLLVFSFSSCAALRYYSDNEPQRATSTIQNQEKRLRNDILLYAKQYLGTKYKYAGKTPASGFDCSGFTYFVMRNFKIHLSPSSRAQALQGNDIQLETAKPGDLVFFRKTKGGRIFHVAMIASNSSAKGLKIIHSTSRGVVIDDLNISNYWKPKISHIKNVVTPAVLP